MNFIAFVFSLLLIFSFGTLVVLEKQSSNQRLRSSYLGHIGANRKLLSQQVSDTYRSLRGKTTVSIDKTPNIEKESEPKIPDINPECARLNLWPLIQEGKQNHPYLYQKALHMLDFFYKEQIQPVKTDVFLNAFLKKAKLAIQKQTFSLEKLSLDPSFQIIYYKMLKGTKILDENGYPSFLDVFKVDETPSRICIHHAHPLQLNALFGNKVGPLLYQEIHQNQSYPTIDLVEKVYAQAHVIPLDPEQYQWFEFGKSTHANKGKTTFIAKDLDTNVTLRKTVYLP